VLERTAYPERRPAVNAAGLFLHALDAQDVAYGPARFDQAEGNSTLREFCVRRQEQQMLLSLT